MAEHGGIDCCFKRPCLETDYCCIQQSFSNPYLFSVGYVITHASYLACIIFKSRLIVEVVLSGWGRGGVVCFTLFLL